MQILLTLSHLNLQGSETKAGLQGRQPALLGGHGVDDESFSHLDACFWALSPISRTIADAKLTPNTQRLPFGIPQRPSACKWYVWGLLATPWVSKARAPQVAPRFYPSLLLGGSWDLGTTCSFAYNGT